MRILVDRLWPRGLTKEKASVDLCLKEIAPSTELRKWFGHHPAKWEEFQTRDLAELPEKRRTAGPLVTRNGQRRHDTAHTGPKAKNTTRLSSCKSF